MNSIKKYTEVYDTPPLGMAFEYLLRLTNDEGLDFDLLERGEWETARKSTWGKFVQARAWFRGSLQMVAAIKTSENKPKEGKKLSESERLQAEILALLGKEFDLPPLPEPLELPVDEEAALDPLADWADVTQAAIQDLQRALLGLVHSTFNRTWTQASSSQGDVPSPLLHQQKFEKAEIAPMISAMSELVQAQEERLAADRRRLHQLANSPANAATWQTTVDQIADATLRDLPGFVTSQAVGSLFMRAVAESGKRSDSEKLGYWLAKAGGLTRESIAQCTAAHMLQAAATAPQLDAAAAELLQKADQLMLALKLPDGKNTEVHKVQSAQTGTLIELRGTIGEVTVSKSSDKDLITKFDLTDPSSKKSVTVAAPYVHFAHLGLVKGAYCIVHGLYDPASNINGGQPALVPDRLALKSQLAKTSWKAAILALAQGHYERWANDLNMDWAIGPHQPANGLLGANELLFP